MRRRLTATIVAVVAGALAVAGAGSLLLAAHAERSHFRDRLHTQAEVISTNLDALVFEKSSANRKNVLTIVSQVSRLEGVAIAVIQPGGTVSPIQPTAPLLGLLGRSAPLPSGLSSADVQPANLQAGRTTSGSKGSLSWVAVPNSIGTSALIPTGLTAARADALQQRLAQIAPSGTLPIVVVVAGKDSGTPGATTWFVLAALAALAVAALVADAVGRRITGPLQAVERAAGRIAAGDLDQRIEIGGGEYPELVSLASSINTMTGSLQDARARERRFIMSVSHDLRTPLTSIRGWAEAIADGAATDQQEAARVIGSEARRLQRLVQDLLDLARLDSDGFSLHMQPTDVSGVVASTAEGLRPMIEGAGLALEVAGTELPVQASADPDRLAQIVANLVENAYKYSSGTIRVSVVSSPEFAVVNVEDDGPGIPNEERDRVFERLYQSASPPARQAGSGLGLAIVKELATAMGGTVEAAPSPAGRGSLVAVRLPGSSESRPASYAPGGGE